MKTPSSSARAYIGISGYNYPGWRGRFYPKDLAARRWLEYASRQFNSIELNGTFYSLKSPAVFRKWVDETPPKFVFAVKGSRFITHNLKLARATIPLANFYASGVLALGEKTGPFLWQLPPTIRFNAERVKEFLELLPPDSTAAARLARRHDARLKKGALLESARRVPYRHAFEARHPSYFTQEFYDLLRACDSALVIADTAGKYPCVEQMTASFVYVRLHGSTRLYASDYSDRELDDWAARATRWLRDGRDVYVYFDNDALGHAPRNALALAARLAELDW
ncbi:MAG TPA: DUF72 domain-containing protein [Gemmatimonadales bacterium]|nr:DUF72 domain-containing protein [Gemmatimonadales bacterium]